MVSLQDQDGSFFTALNAHRYVENAHTIAREFEWEKQPKGKGDERSVDKEWVTSA